jgi:hypothetical protein
LREGIPKGPEGIRGIRKGEKEILEKGRRDLKFSFLRSKWVKDLWYGSSR